MDDIGRRMANGRREGTPMRLLESPWTTAHSKISGTSELREVIAVLARQGEKADE